MLGRSEINHAIKQHALLVTGWAPARLGISVLNVLLAIPTFGAFALFPKPWRMYVLASLAGLWMLNTTIRWFQAGRIRRSPALIELQERLIRVTLVCPSIRSHCRVMPIYRANHPFRCFRLGWRTWVSAYAVEHLPARELQFLIQRATAVQALGGLYVLSLLFFAFVLHSPIVLGLLVAAGAMLMLLQLLDRADLWMTLKVDALTVRAGADPEAALPMRMTVLAGPAWSDDN